MTTLLHTESISDLLDDEDICIRLTVFHVLWRVFCHKNIAINDCFGIVLRPRRPSGRSAIVVAALLIQASVASAIPCRIALYHCDPHESMRQSPATEAVEVEEHLIPRVALYDAQCACALFN